MKTILKRDIALFHFFFLFVLLPSGFACAGGLQHIPPLGALSFTLSHHLQVASPDENPVTPYRGLTYTAAGIEEVRSMARETDRGRAMAEEIFASATPWLNMSDDRIRSLLPPQDALFATGVAGDPKTGQSWSSGNICSLNRPGIVRSPYTGDLYGNDPYYDPGDGWVRPSDGQRFYFKGIWNAWIVQRMHEAADDLALAYMLTGNEAIAARGLLILDGLATLKAKRGEEPGFIDSTSYGTSTNSNFLAYGGNGANDRQFQTALSLDLLAGAGCVHNPSGGMPGRTIFENLRDNYFAIYELSYKESRSSLYNHTTALFANQIAQAVLFGRPESLKEGLDVIDVWLNQCLTRDGQYYENAGGYERVGIDYFSKMLLPLVNYTPGNYENAGEFPDANNIHYGDDPRWYSAALLMKYRMMAIGRIICLGDMWEDRLVLAGRTRGEEKLWCTYARLLYSQTTRPEWREQISQGYWRLPDSVRNESSLDSIRSIGMNQWLEPAKPANPLPVGPAADFLLSQPSDFLPGKMIALMRGGTSTNARAAFLCGSVHYSHGNDDQMGLLLYAKGLCLTGIYGYPLAGSPAHRGWAMKPASHCTLVVNEDLPEPKYPAKNAPPASLQGWLTKWTGLSVQMVEMSNPHLWRERIATDMTEYRRLLWMVDVSDTEFYFLDFFRATGGRTHDYFWTGQWLDSSTPGNGFSVQGVSPQSVPGVWSLAGFNASYSNQYYNQPGLSWGERVIKGQDGRIAYQADSNEQINVNSSWNPPPGNGYGFIYDVRRAETTNNWSAKWKLIDGKNTMRLTFVNGETQQAITAFSPAFTVDRCHSMAIARRTGTAPLQSRFAGLIEVAASERWPVLEAHRLNIDPSVGMGVSLSLTNGCTDITLAGSSASADIQLDGVALKGARGFIRKSADGTVAEMMLHEGTELTSGDCMLRLSRPAWTGMVTRVAPSDLENQVSVNVRFPDEFILQGQPAIFSDVSNAPSPAYLQDEAYLIEQVTDDENGGSVLHFGQQRLVSSKVVVDSIAEDGAVLTTWPNEILGGRYYDTGYFTGRQVVAVSGSNCETRVVSYPGRKMFYPADPGRFHAGDQLEFRTVCTGDCVRIPAVAALKNVSPGVWRLTANAEVSLRVPSEPGDAIFLIYSNRYERIAETTGTQIECSIPVQSISTGGVQFLVGSAPLLARYSFDEATNLVKDSSGNGNDLSTNPGFSTPVYSAAGKNGGAASFDGSAGWITPGGLYPKGSFTITAWVKPADTNIVNIIEPTTRRGGASMYHAGGDFRFRIFDSGSNYTYRVGPKSVPNEWRHLAMTYNATNNPDASGNYSGTFRVYVNGVYISGVEGKYAAPAEHAMQLGTYGTSPDIRPYRGLIDEVSVYSGALSQTAVSNLMSK